MGTLHGDKSPVKQAGALSYSPATGWVSTKQYVGTDSEIRALAAQIKKEKTDDDAGTPATVNLQITPAGGGLSTLDISSDDDIGSGVESTTWSLQASDYEKSIWTHPTIRSLANICPTQYKFLRENAERVGQEGTFDATIAGWDCTASDVSPYAVKYDLYNEMNGAADPNTGAAGAAAVEASTGRQFSVGSIWVDVLNDKAYVCSVKSGTGFGSSTWVHVNNKCCVAAKIILTYFRDGIDSYIISQYVLRKSITLPTSTKDIYGLTNVNKRVNTWQMENKEGVPTGLKFAMPDYGEWLKKAPSVQYERTKMSIEQEYWHSEDWNDYLYQQATY